MDTFDELKNELSQYYPIWDFALNELSAFLYNKLSQEDFNFVLNKILFMKRDFPNHQNLMNKICNKCMLDATTGLYSNVFYDEKLSQLSNNYDIAFLMADVDYFKKYNDSYGHVQGNKALWCISQQFKKSLETLVLDSENLSVMRFGGEEFCAFIENWQRCDNELYGIADSVRCDVEFIEIEKAKGENPLNDGYKHSTITIAMGMRNCFEDIEHFVDRVDYHLTRKNSDGRNRVYP